VLAVDSGFMVHGHASATLRRPARVMRSLHAMPRLDAPRTACVEPEAGKLMTT